VKGAYYVLFVEARWLCHFMHFCRIAKALAIGHRFCAINAVALRLEGTKQ